MEITAPTTRKLLLFLIFGLFYLFSVCVSRPGAGSLSLTFAITTLNFFFFFAINLSFPGCLRRIVAPFYLQCVLSCISVILEIFVLPFVNGCIFMIMAIHGHCLLLHYHQETILLDIDPR